MFKKGSSLNLFPFRVNYLLSRESFDVPAGKAFKTGFPVQFGAGVSSRNFKKAVQRNRIKRLCREAWRLQKPALYAVAGERNCQLAVFLIFTGKELPDYNAVYAAVTKVIQKLSAIIQKQVHEVAS